MYGQSEAGVITRLNKEPLLAPAFTDALFHQQKPTQYTVVLMGPGAERVAPKKDAATWVTAQAKPLRKEPVFTLVPGAPGMTLKSGAAFQEGVLVTGANGFATVNATPLFNGGPFSLVAELSFDAVNEMPVVAGLGDFQGRGWFLQCIGRKWRFHLGGVSCDGGTLVPGQWTRVVATYDGTMARLYQDGVKVGECAVPKEVMPRGGEGHIGQYHAGGEASYQFHGKIRSLEIYQRVVTVSVE